jgi:hypothetical protein
VSEQHQQAGGTKLGVIRRHDLYVICGCCHDRLVRVSELIEALGDQATVGFAIGKIRCSVCRQKDVLEYRIVYPGGSANKMYFTAQIIPVEPATLPDDI